MKTLFPFEQVNGQSLTPEQRLYLEGLTAGLRNRGVKFSDVEAAPEPKGGEVKSRLDETWTAEERIKHELHPLDAYPLILEHAEANRFPDRENTFRFKWNGLFYLTPAKEGYMCRLRIPGGQLKSFQLRELSRIASELTTGYVQITTRANLQMRLIMPKDAPALLTRIQNIGLHSRGSGADNIRNITASPTAGIDPFEVIDVLPYCHELSQLIISSREFYNLPRKFNIALDGGGLISSVEETNDIGASAVEVKSEGGPVPPGVYFRIKLGGATGHLAFAKDLGVMTRPQDVVKTIAAAVRVYIRLGSRTDRKRSRLKWLLETMTLEQYLDEMEKELGFKLTRAPLEAAGAGPTAGAPRRPHPQAGVYPQKQKGLNYLGVGIPVGHITPKQMTRLAEISDLYGSGEVRLTVWENLVIPNIPDAFVETVKKTIEKLGFHWQQSNLRSGLVACTGNSYCKFAAANTKGHALELVDYLDKKLKLDMPLNIHLTGCPNSCAQHYMGDIGLLGTKVKVGGESVEGYHVFVGGGFGENQALGRQVFNGISFSELKPTLEKMLKGYLRHRQAGESFLAFSKRNDLNTLQAIFSNDE